MDWSLDDSKFIYGVNRDDLYFLDINEKGELILKIEGNKIAFTELITRVKSEIHKHDSSVFSFSLRIPQLIKEQVSKLSNLFTRYIEQYQYQGSFKMIYPIKVNSLQYVLETIKNVNPSYSFEAGTVNELSVLLELLNDSKNRMIMCNGVKDSEYIEKIKEGIEKGYNIVVSLESCNETINILKSIDNQLLKLALRIKPYPTVKSHWGSSSGRDAKFGLSISEFKKIITLLEENNVKDKVYAIHAHPGSQIIDIDGLRNFVLYLAKRYLELKKRGFIKLLNIDFGGGIPINYDSRLPLDIVENYVKTLLGTLVEVIRNHEDQPNIWIEAGRYVTAPSSLIVVETIAHYSIFPLDEKERNKKDQFSFNKLTQESTIEDVFKLWTEFSSPDVDSDINTIFEKEKAIKHLKNIIRKKIREVKDEHKFTEIFDQKYGNFFSEIYSPEHILVGNFSVFNTIIDWLLVGQYFPILPITNLEKQPSSLVRLVDKTCDSDGEISIYHPRFREKEVLYTRDNFPLTVKEKKFNLSGFPIGKIPDTFPQYLVIALTGAYQDNIKMHHNLIEPLEDIMIVVKNEQYNISYTKEVNKTDNFINS